jgi:parallel beta-helix repeat protein
VTIADNIITENSADSGGGGICISDDSTAEITGNTINYSFAVL